MPLVPAILPALDTVRAVGGVLGMRVYSVTHRTRTWTGNRPGLAGTTSTDVDIAITNVLNGTAYPVRISPLTRNDAIASGGRYVTGDFRVGPITPSFAAGFANAAGYNDAVLDPTPVANAVQVFWLMNGPGLATNTICEKVGEEANSMHYILFLRPTGRTPT